MKNIRGRTVRLASVLILIFLISALLPAPASGQTSWGAPVLISPNSGVTLFHYPRVTALAWMPVAAAVSYVVERQYLSGTVWIAYPNVVVSGNLNTTYTANFIGDQKGRWRVTAYNGVSYSTASPWWTFTFNTKPQMATPTLVSPAAEAIFGNYPRTTTLAWKTIPAAVGYKLEIAWCNSARTSCTNAAPITISNPLASSYTFSFVGAQPGKWRVTALGGATYRDSAASGWRWFTYLQ